MCDCLWQPEKPGKERKSESRIKKPTNFPPQIIKKDKSHKQTAKTPVLQTAEKQNKTQQVLNMLPWQAQLEKNDGKGNKIPQTKQLPHCLPKSLSAVHSLVPK